MPELVIVFLIVQTTFLAFHQLMSSSRMGAVAIGSGGQAENSNNLIIARRSTERAEAYVADPKPNDQKRVPLHLGFTKLGTSASVLS